MIGLDNQGFNEKKRTKIVATISDRNCSPEFIRSLYENGMNVVRFNTAHQAPAETLPAVQNVRKASNKIAIMIDTKGPEVRTTKAVDDFKVTTGDKIKIYSNNPEGICADGVMFVNYPGFSAELNVGNAVLIDDGALALEVIEKNSDHLVVQAKNNGVIASRKSVNTPGVSLDLPSLSPKDREYIDFCIDNDIDFIAHSFVRRKQDLIDIQEILDARGSKCKIISKIENLEGVQNIEEILDHCFGIMVARGDLAVEIPREKVPAIQKELVKLCVKKRKPVIIATQMLHSMMHNPFPTRAEVSDVANAVFDGVDAIMLSGETAQGEYPLESVRQMNDIALEVEQHTAAYNNIDPVIVNTEVSAHLCKAAVESAVVLNAKAIVADTTSGNTIRNMVGFRSREPIYALCYNERTMRELSLSYGVTAFPLDQIERDLTDEFLSEVILSLKDRYNYKPDDLIVFLSGNYGREAGASFLKVSTIENIEKWKK